VISIDRRLNSTGLPIKRLAQALRKPYVYFGRFAAEFPLGLERDTGDGEK
jgi:hypothetical protein